MTSDKAFRKSYHRCSKVPPVWIRTRGRATNCASLFPGLRQVPINLSSRVGCDELVQVWILAASLVPRTIFIGIKEYGLCGLALLDLDSSRTRVMMT